MYKVSIHTEAYKPLRCSKRNWENGTINDFMEAFNGWKITEPNLKKLEWRIGLFLHNAGGWEDDEYFEWLRQPKNDIGFFDKLCDMERISRPEVYGFAQGYFPIDKALKELKETGKCKIQFSAAYDARQYLKNMDGCYMQIVKTK